MIQATSLAKNYGSKRAVDDVSFTVQPGKVTGFLGPNGAGKSTTMRMIVGLEDITSGELSIGGERVNEKAPKDRDIAMVFQSYALYPHMTVRQNIAFPLTLAKMKKDEIAAKVEETAKILDLTGLTRPLRTVGLGLGSLAQITLPVPGSSDLLTTGSLGEGVEVPIGSLGSAGTNGGSLGSEGQALKLNGQSVGDTFCNAVDGVGLDAIGGEIPALGSAMNPNGSLESASAGLGSGGK